MDKSRLRRRFLSLRESLDPEEIAASSVAICERLAAWSLVRDARSVLTYLAFRSEPDLNLLFDLLPETHWFVPRVCGLRLAIHAYDPDHLQLHRFGMMEPTPDLPAVDPTTLELVLVPGLAFDAQGTRLGLGGGYYDRWLPTTPAVRLGIALECCLAGSLPRDAHDQAMDWIVTPARIIDCSAVRTAAQ